MFSFYSIWKVNIIVNILRITKNSGIFWGGEYLAPPKSDFIAYLFFKLNFYQNYLCIWFKRAKHFIWYLYLKNSNSCILKPNYCSLCSFNTSSLIFGYLSIYQLKASALCRKHHFISTGRDFRRQTIGIQVRYSR